MNKFLRLVVAVMVFTFISTSMAWAAPKENQGARQEQQSQKKNDQKNKNSQQKENRNTKGKPADNSKHNNSGNKNQHKVNNNSRGKPADNGKHDASRNEQSKTYKRGNPGGNVNHAAVKNAEHNKQETKNNEHQQYRRYFENSKLRVWDRRWPETHNWKNRPYDWGWFTSFPVAHLRAYYGDDRHERLTYLHFEPQHGRYFDQVQERYGHYTCSRRHFVHGGYGWSYYWFGPQNIICVFVGDNGYVRTFIWHRAELESQVITLGIMSPEFMATYSQYNGDIPEEMATVYVRDVIDPVTDTE